MRCLITDSNLEGIMNSLVRHGSATSGHSEYEPASSQHRSDGGTVYDSRHLSDASNVDVSP